MARQFAQTSRAMHHILALVHGGRGLVLTHGNGPQVGHILIRAEAARKQAYTIPLSVAVAQSQGEIGYVIQQALYNEMAKGRFGRPIVSLLTQVLVDPLDPAFATPTKPIGPYYSDAQAEPLRRQGIPLAFFAGDGWRRVVASPRPLKIIEASAVRWLVEHGVVVVAAGGGGIPVYQVGNRLKGLDAVIDKDTASAVLAESIGADLLLILTDVPNVALNYQQPDQVDLDCMSAAEAERYLSQGHFPPGTMGPKVEAAIQFVRASRGKAIITTPEAMELALAGEDGTQIVP